MRPELYISLDLETSGLDPLRHSILSIGAVRVHGGIVDNGGAPPGPRQSFYTLVKPRSAAYEERALQVNGLSLHTCAQRGLEGYDALRKLGRWIEAMRDGNVGPTAPRPILVGLNPAFDLGFLNVYWHIHDLPNPFYYAPIDVKSMYFASQHCLWQETKGTTIPELGDRITHNALDDARAVADLFVALRQI